MEDCEAGKEDLWQRLEDRDQAHVWIQAKLQVTFIYWRFVALEACEEDLRQRLEDRDQAHAWIQESSNFLIEEDSSSGGWFRGSQAEAGGQGSGTCLDSGQASGNFLILEDCRPGGR